MYNSFYKTSNIVYNVRNFATQPIMHIKMPLQFNFSLRFQQKVRFTENRVIGLLARIDQNRQKFNKEKVDLGVIIDVAVDSMKELAAQKDILLFSNVPEGTIVDADESLLLSAITNLISNGIKYGNESGHVSVSASKNGDKTEIIVADNGVGISEEHIDKIWTRFYRVDDVRIDEYGSSGLGLSMVKSIIELHGGEITVKSTPGHGTEFRIIL